MRSSAKLYPIALLALGIASVAGCGAKDTARGPEPDPVPRSGDIRFFNAIADAPDLVAFLNGSPTEPVPFGLVVSRDGSIVGRYRIDVGYLDAQNDFVPIVDDLNIELYEDHERTVLVDGTLANPSFTIIENEEFLFGLKGAPVLDPEVQFVNAAAAAGVLEFHLTAPAAVLGSATAVLDFEGRTEITSVPPGDYQLRITPAGQPNTVLYDSGTFPLSTTSRATFFAINYVGPGGAGVRIVRVNNFGLVQLFNNDALPTALRFGNFVADLPAADLYFGDPASTTPVFEDIAFGQFSPYLQIAGGSQDIQITAANVPDPALHTQSVSLLKGFFGTFYLGGVTATPSVAGSYAIDDNRVVGVRSNVRFFQGSPAAGTINVFLLQPGQTTQGATANFANAALGGSGVVRLVPGAYDLVIEDAQGVSLYGPDRIEVQAGATHLLTVTDTAGGGAPFEVNFGLNP